MHGLVPVCLIVDNCSAHKVNAGALPQDLVLKFLSPIVTSKRQPADMGIIASFKVGYKFRMLSMLLSIFDKEGGYKTARLQRARQKRGCKGLAYGGKPHVLDAMDLLHNVWSCASMLELKA